MRLLESRPSRRRHRDRPEVLLGQRPRRGRGPFRPPGRRERLRRTGQTGGVGLLGGPWARSLASRWLRPRSGISAASSGPGQGRQGVGRFLTRPATWVHTTRPDPVGRSRHRPRTAPQRPRAPVGSASTTRAIRRLLAGTPPGLAPRRPLLGGAADGSARGRREGRGFVPGEVVRPPAVHVPEDVVRRRRPRLAEHGQARVVRPHQIVQERLRRPALLEDLASAQGMAASTATPRSRRALLASCSARGGTRADALGEERAASLPAAAARPPRFAREGALQNGSPAGGPAPGPEHHPGRR